MNNLSVVIQAGGKSTRMGRDKGLISFRGVTMIEFVLRQIEGLGSETLIITNKPEEYRFLNLPVYSDVIADWGALGGLYSAIYQAHYDTCLVLACDMPFVNRPLLDYLINRLPGYDAVIPRLDPNGNASPVFAEPFRAVYRKSCLNPIKAAIDAGQRRVISFFDQVNIRFVGRSEIEVYDPDYLTFFNINTPEDLMEGERLWFEEGE